MQKSVVLVSFAILVFSGCGEQSAGTVVPAPKAAPKPAPAADLPPVDKNNILNIAIGSKDHTTLVAALKAADYVRAVSNAGPLTVFAPTNAAFAKLPPGTLETLMKPENQDKLKEILQYHVSTSVYEADQITDGQVLAMANGKKVTLHKQDGKITVNDANVIASVRGSNGVVHVIDGVLPPAEK